MPKINDIKIVKKKQPTVSLTTRGKNNDDILKILKEDNFLKNFKLNNVASTNDYFEKRKTEYPFEGFKSHRAKDVSHLIPLSSNSISTLVPISKPKLL